MEELNYLAKRLDSFDTGEAAQFQAMAHKLELFELKAVSYTHLDVYKRQPLGQMYGYRLKGIYTVDDFTYDAAQQK